MQLLAEISMYPLTSNYIGPIDEFLARLNADSAVEVKTNRMSTQLFGEYNAVMALLTSAIGQVSDGTLRASFVVKYLPGAQRTVGEYS